MTDLSLIPLPPIGVDIPCSWDATGVPLKVDTLGLLNLDFQGDINFRVRTSKADALVLEVQDFRVEADSDPDTPDSGILVTITMSNTTTTPLSVLQASPTGALELVVHLSPIVEVIDKNTGETIHALFTDPSKPATFGASGVQQFPPINQLCTLREPVTLYPGGGDSRSTTPVGELPTFDVILSRST